MNQRQHVFKSYVDFEEKLHTMWIKDESPQWKMRTDKQI